MSIETPQSAYPDNINSQDVFVALDFDRTLGNVEKVYGLFAEVVAEHEPELAAALVSRRTEVENNNKSFEPISIIRDEYGQEKVDALLELFVAKANDGEPGSLFEDGAGELLDTLEGHDAPHGIVTWGESYEWQEAKIKAAFSGRTTPSYLITQERSKGKLLREGYDEEAGLFHLPETLGGKAFQAILLADDKSSSFSGFEAPSMNGWLYRPKDRKLLLSQLGGAPKHISTVAHLDQIRADIDRVYQRRAA